MQIDMGVMWTTKDGQVMPIVTMTDRHLVHAMNLMIRKGDELLAAGGIPSGPADWVVVMMKANRADLEEMEILHPEFEAWHDKFRALVIETKRRGLWVVGASGQLIVPPEVLGEVG